MRLLFVADGRSPIALNWIVHFVEAGHEVHLLSTSPCKPDLDLSSLYVVPVAFSGVGMRLRVRSSDPSRELHPASATDRPSIGGVRMIDLRSFLRHWLGPLTIPWAAKQMRERMQAVQPDLVHAMRIPFEAIMTTAASPSAPLLISVWGNDFTLHAPSTPWMGWLTRRALAYANGLHVDCQRDLNLAYDLGFSREWPKIVLPGGGGVRPEIFHPGSPDLTALDDRLAVVLSGIPREAPVVINPRGFRAYVRNDTFFQAVPRILEVHPKTVFLCPSMANQPQARSWIEQLGIGAAVRLLPMLSPIEMAATFQRAQVTVSPTEHDGTPNTLLEAIACGCFPVASDLESIREWIDDGVNGLLVDPGDPDALARSVNRALTDSDMRAQAVKLNSRLIAQRATYSNVMDEAEAFYRKMTG